MRGLPVAKRETLAMGMYAMGKAVDVTNSN